MFEGFDDETIQHSGNNYNTEMSVLAMASLWWDTRFTILISSEKDIFHYYKTKQDWFYYSITYRKFVSNITEMKPQADINFQRVAEAIEYIQQHFKEQPSLEDIADNVHVSPYHFQRIFSDWLALP